MDPLWVFTSYLLLKTAFNTCIFIDTCYFSLANVPYRKVNCLFLLAMYRVPVPTVRLFSLCLSHSYLPTLYINCSIDTYHLFSFLLGNLSGLPILCAAKMDSFPLFCGIERTVFTIYLSTKLYFLAGNQPIYPQNENCYFQASSQ
jgi:hypothetical protein